MSPLNEEHLRILGRGLNVWNSWRETNDKIKPQLEGAKLAGANLVRMNLDNVNLRDADLAGADLGEAYLAKTDLRGAKLDGASLLLSLAIKTRFEGASMVGADMRGGIFVGAQFQKAKLRDADLQAAQLTESDLSGADLTGAKVYGVSAWKIKLESVTPDGPLVAIQKDLVITSSSKEQKITAGRDPGETTGGEEEIRVDDLRLAQLIYLVQDNARFSDVIQGLSERTVLLLGRFTDERMAVLEVIRDKLRKHDLLPVIFNFRRPKDRDWTETVRILAGLSRFVIVDLTDPSSVPLELEAVVPSYQIPFVPIFEGADRPFAMFQNLYNQFDWVLEPFRYDRVEDLEACFEPAILKRAEDERERVNARKGRTMVTVTAADFPADGES